MSRDRKAEALSLLDAADAAGEIYNAVYVEIKEDLNRAFEAEASKIQHELSRDITRLLWDNLYSLSGSDFTLARYNSQVKQIAKAKKEGIALDYVALDALMAEWGAIAARVEVWKPLVKKGRKPIADDQRKTPVRTIENTGTCPVCFRNIKRDGAGNMVEHGYKITENGRPLYQRVGKCYGVGYQPYELSTSGTERYLHVLKNLLANQNETLEIHLHSSCVTFLRNGKKVTLAAGELGFEMEHGNKKREIEFTIRQLTSDIAFFTERIDCWTEAPLPA